MRIALFTIILFAVVFLLGDLFLSLIGWRKTVGAALAWGVAFLLTVLQFVAYPLFLLHASFSLFFVLFSLVMLALLFFSLRCLVRDRERTYGEQLRSLGREARAHPVSTAMVLIITAAYFYRVFFFHYPDSDDAYYLARAMEAVAQNALHLDHTFIWTGLASDALGGVTDASTFEYLKAYFSVLSGIHVSIICRTGLLLILVLAHFGAILSAADSLDREEHGRYVRRCVFFAVYLSCQLTSRMMSSSGVWMTNSLWQGKSLLPALIFPLLLAACATLCERADSFRPVEWLSAMTALTAGVAASIAGIFLAPIFYMVMGLAFLLAVRFRNAGRIVGMAALSALPVIVCVAFCYADILTNTTRLLTDLGSLGPADWMEQVYLTMEKPHIFLMGLSLVYLIVCGTKLQKQMLVLPALILLVSFANPLLIHPVSQYLTTAMVYWRVFWVLPVMFAPAFAAASAVDRIAGEKAEQALLCALGALGLCFLLLRPWGGTEPLELAFRNKDKNPRTNIYELQDSTLAIADTILDGWTGEGRPVLLAEEYCAMEIRQYTVDIALAGGVRDDQRMLFRNLIYDSDYEESEVYMYFFYPHFAGDPVLLHELLETDGVDYVVFSTKRGWDLSAGGFTELWHGEDYTLWQI